MAASIAGSTPSSLTSWIDTNKTKISLLVYKTSLVISIIAAVAAVFSGLSAIYPLSFIVLGTVSFFALRQTKKLEEAAQLKTALFHLEENNKVQKTQLSIFSHENSKLQKNTKEYREELEKFKKEITSLKEVRTDLQKQIKEIKEEFPKMTAKAKELLAQLEKNNTAHTEGVQKFTQQNERLKAYIDTVTSGELFKQEQDKLQKVSSELSTTKEGLEKERLELTQVREDLKRSVEGLGIITEDLRATYYRNEFILKQMEKAARNLTDPNQM